MTKHPILTMCGLLAIGVLSGCITPGKDAKTVHNPDPWEQTNRKIFAFNDALDGYVLKPVAEGYRTITPDFVETGVSNFFSNIGDIFVVVNDLLQFKIGQAASDTARIVVNTTVGIGGLFDVASHINLLKHDEDFGQTLGFWGLDSGPYLVLPFFGPSTLRDTGARLASWNSSDVKAGSVYVIDPLKNAAEGDALLGLRMLDVVDLRAGLLDREKTLNAISLDKYATLRNVYLQNRAFKVYDGEIPERMSAETGEDEMSETELEAFEDVDAMLEEDDDL